MAMTVEEYSNTAAKIGEISGMVANLPLTEFLKEIKHAEKLGPRVDPHWMKDGKKTLENMRKIAQKMHELQVIVCEYFHD